MVSLPPGIQFTPQLTPVSALPVPLDVNTCVSPRRTFVVPGTTLTNELAPFTWALIAPEIPDPGLGFVTVTGTVPTCAFVAVPVPVTCEEEIRGVVSAPDPKLAVAPAAKWAPERV